jgi:hypothetical protein
VSTQYALKDAPNTVVMTDSYEEGVDRGDAAEQYVHRMLPGSEVMPRTHPFDIRTASGVRIDVKATRRGNDLMIPNQQRAKVDPARLDALLLVYEDPFEIVGWVTPEEFIERKQNGDHMKFPCRFVAVSDLNSTIPWDWMQHA